MTATQYKTETVFDYTWKQVVQAYWNRYPNPSSTHVLTEDTISREVREGKLYSRRLLTKVNPVPKWGQRFYHNAPPVKIVEDSVLDLKKRTLTTFTRNIGFKKIMKVDEIVEYSEQKDGRTLAVRRAYISSQVFGFSRAIRAFGVERFKSNCHKASNGFNFVLRNMFPHHVALAAAATPLTGAATTTTTTTITKTEQHATGMGSTTTTTTTSTATTASSKTEAIKKATINSYNYVKGHASKLAQMFSVKN